MANNTTPRLESIQGILDRGYRSASMLILLHFPTRTTQQIYLKGGELQDPAIDKDEKIYIFRASFP